MSEIFIVESKKFGEDWMPVLSDFYSTEGEAEAEVCISKQFYKNVEFRAQKYIRGEE